MIELSPGTGAVLVGEKKEPREDTPQMLEGLVLKLPAADGLKQETEDLSTTILWTVGE